MLYTLNVHEVWRALIQLVAGEKLLVLMGSWQKSAPVFQSISTKCHQACRNTVHVG